MKPSSPAAFRLMMDGSAAFADMEARGIRVDVAYLDRVIKETGSKIKQIEKELRDDPVYAVWRRRYGEKTNLGSREQLAQVVFGEMGVETTRKTAGGRPKMDAEALEDIDFPFAKKWNSLEKLKKARGTYLKGIRRETVVDDGVGYIHPFYNLHLATTYRSSSSEPNFHNQPVRDPRQAKLIRRAFVPRKGHILVEADYGALEFRGAANFWRDPAMVAYASDSSLDIHRDMAAECFDLEIDDVTKQARSFAKNQFVFPRLYGSYYVNIAGGLWQSIGRANLTTKSGEGLYEHLKRRGIADLGRKPPKENPPEGTFLRHIQQVEERFNDRFPHWSKEKDVWWEKYLSRGWFELLTGFVCSGVFSYNNLMNTPIQGPSFHCLLWSVIELNKWLKEHKMRSMIVGQIHDSIFADVYLPELQDYLNAAREIMTQKLRQAWTWILTPMEVEFEASERSWFDKKPWIEENGLWRPAA